MGETLFCYVYKKNNKTGKNNSKETFQTHWQVKEKRTGKYLLCKHTHKHEIFVIIIINYKYRDIDQEK